MAETAAVAPTLTFANPTHFRALLGNHDEHIRLLERSLGVRIEVGEGTLTLGGDAIETELAGRVLDQLYGLIEQGYPIYPSDVDYALRILSSDHAARLRDIFLDTVFISATRHTITPKSVAQKAYIDAIRNYDIVFGIGPAGTGKCIAGSSLVLTTDGLVPIQSLGRGTAAGEQRPIDVEVSGLSGREAASHVYNGGRSRVLRVTTRLGLEIQATPEHPLLSLRSDGVLEWARTDGLRVGDFVAVQRGQEMFGSETAIRFEYRPNGPYDHAKPIAIDRLDEELAYLLGVLTGDGCLTFRSRVILSSADPEIVERFRAFADRLGLTVFRNGGDRPYDYIIASARLYQLLIGLGMSSGKAATKCVPEAVLRAPRDIVRAFLSGLFDSDGTTERRAGCPSLCSASRRLVDEVQIALLNFGILSARRTRRVAYRGTIKEYHELEMRGAEAERFHTVIGFGLARKQRVHRPVVRNTNVDVIPHVASLIDAAARAQVLSRADHKLLYDYRINRRSPSYAKLGSILEIVATAAAGYAYRRLQDLYERHLFWAEVTEIAEGEADVYDLTVPGTHSFCANGFVNHNTYLAMAMAVAELMKNSFARIVLCRPAVEAGEKLGFLPGDLAEKVNPYLRPLYDALNDMVDFDRARKLIERGTIEVAPLAFMRGRAQPTTCRVLTHLGWRQIGELEPGDYVIGSDGHATRVLGVYPQGEKEVFRVTATDGASTRCSGDHLWAVQTLEDRRRNKGFRVVTVHDMIGRLRREHQHRFELPMSSGPARFAPQDVPLEPYALGLLLGDGCLAGTTTPAFATGDPELSTSLEGSLEGIEVVRKSAVDYVLRHRFGGRGGLRIPNPVSVAARSLGLWGTRSSTKFVPPAYLWNTPEVRLAVLQGLLDTDGGPVLQDGRTCRIQFCTTSPHLRDDVVFLVRSLGGIAYWRTRAADGRKPGRAKGRDVPYRSDAYVLEIRLPREIAPFRLGRKARAYALAGGGRPMRFIRSIEPDGTEECVCIRVAAPDSLYVTDDFILTHNTLNDSFVILDEAQNTTSEQMKMFLTRLGYGSKAVVTGDVTQIDLPAGKQSGLKEAQLLLRDIDGIRFVTFTERDVVRHPLVQEIIGAYDRSER